MATEEFSTSHKEFWYSFLKFLSVIPVFMVIGFGVAYFVGTFRPHYINQYNKEAAKWVNGGLEEFSGLLFNMTNSSGEETFKEMKQTPGGFYPMYDRCNKKGDPAGGCLHTEARYYDEDIIWMHHENHHRIYDKNGNVIVERRLDGSLNYTRSAKELGCRSHMDICQERCDEMDGFWDPYTKLCNIQVFADNICYRIKKEGDKWVLDTNNQEKLPQNKDFSMYPSDGLGCDYGNNWNSVHYGKKAVSDIRIQLRSSLDSYIAASAYTRSCSNDAPVTLNCFGPTHHEQKKSIILGLYISLGLVGVVILCYLVVFIISRVKYNKAVRDSTQTQAADSLLPQTV